MSHGTWGQVSGSVVHESQDSMGPREGVPGIQVRLVLQKKQPGVSMQVPQREAASLYF